jgi:tape measure domain
MASPTLNLLIQIQSNLSQLNSTIAGLNNLVAAGKQVQQVSLGWADAFKFAGAKEALDGVVDGLKKVGDLMVDVVKKSVEQAALIQAEEFPLTAMLRDSGVVAKEILEGITSLWQKAGQISSESLTNTTRALILMDVPAENLVTRLTEMSKISVGTGLDLDQLASGLTRLRQAVQNQTEPMIRGMGGFGAATSALMKILEESLGKTRDELNAMFKAGKISFDDINQAMKNATTGTGAFVDAFEKKRAIYEGAVTNLSIAWKGFLFNLGTPIIDTLTPILNKWADRVRQAGDEGTSMGEKIAEAIEHIDDTIEHLDIKAVLLGKFREAGEAIDAHYQAKFNELWDVILVQIPKKEWEVFSTWFKTANAVTWGQIADQTKTVWTTFWDWMKQQAQETMDVMEHMEVPSLPKQVVTPGPENLPPPELGPSEMFPTPVEEAPPVVKEFTTQFNAAKELATVLHQLEMAMAAVHQQQNLIAAKPFIGADERSRELLQSYNKEILDLEKGIARVQALQRTGLLNEPQMAEANAQIQKANNQIAVLRQRVLGLAEPLRKELTDWANSFRHNHAAGWESH